MLIDSDHAEAVLFFDKGRVIKEVLYSEFQAVLDNYVPMQDLADREMKAVYIRVNSQLHVIAAVFFRIELDYKGFIVKSWNMPLQQFADNSASGPDMGSGPIKLACYSQCSIAWHQKNLWDPVMKSGLNDFITIKKSIKNNNLSLLFKVEPKSSAGLSEEFSESLERIRVRSARKIKEYRLRMVLLESKSKKEMHNLMLEHQQRLDASKNDYEAQIRELTNSNEHLKEDIVGQADKITGMREYFEGKLKIAQDNEQSGLEAMRAYYEAELDAQLDAATLDIKSDLQAKDVELMYRKEREIKLQTECIQLQKDHQDLLQSHDGTVLDQLSAAGINLSIYHPGAGHLTIPYNDIAIYLDNAQAYVAKYCKVSESTYRAWLEHFYSPSCQHPMGNDDFCDFPLDPIEDPSDFIEGESNRCQLHHHHIKDHEFRKSI